MKVIFVSVALAIGFLGIYASPGGLDREVEETLVNHLKASRTKRAPDQFARMVHCSINKNDQSAWDHFNLVAYGCYCGPLSNYRNPDAIEAVDEVDMCCKIHDECWYDALNNLKYTFCVDLGWFGRPCHSVRCDGRNPLLRYDFDYDTCICNDMETEVSTTDETSSEASTTDESTTWISTTEESTTGVSTTEETTTEVSTTEQTTTEVSTTEETSSWVSTTGESTTGVSTTEETGIEVECYTQTDGVDYRGTVYTIETGKTCQKWTSQTPHEHNFTPANNPNSGLGDHNCCRNPDDDSRPWCYTTDSNDRWGVLRCRKSTEFVLRKRLPGAIGGFRGVNLRPAPAYFKPCPDGVDYRGTVTNTVIGKTCQKWTSQTPHSHTRTPANYPYSGLGDHNYCRNPDGDDRAWCYTTDSNDRWEYCDVGNPQTSCIVREVSTSEETTTRVSTTVETDEEENEEDDGYEEIEEVTDEEKDEEENEEDEGYEEIGEVTDEEEEHSENVECLNILCACDTAFVACLRRANADPDGDGEPYSPVPPCE